MSGLDVHIHFTGGECLSRGWLLHRSHLHFSLSLCGDFHLPASMSVPPFTMALILACPVSLSPISQSASLCLPGPLLPLSPLPGMSAGGLSPVYVPLLLLASNPCWAVNSLLVLSVRVTRVPCPFSSCCPAHCLGGCAPCVPTCPSLTDLHCFTE